jgi:multicomponent Na+:H+ antiporter subunit D
MIALPISVLMFGALGLALLDGTRKRNGWLAVAILFMAHIATLWLGWDVYHHGTQATAIGGWDQGVGITLRVDMVGIIFAVLCQVVLLAALIYEVISDVGARIFPSLVLFLAVGLTGLTFTGDAFNFYVFFEIAMMTSYILVSYGETPRQFRAAFVFITVNLLGSMLFLIGVAAIYHTTGFLDMVRIREQMPLVQENPAILTATIIFVAFCVKLGLFPFHFWLPTVYTGTRPAVAAMLSGALANIGTYGLIRFGLDIFPRELEAASWVLLVLGSASILYGGVQALSRHAPAEVLAYSAIGQVGYIMIALAFAGPAGLAAVILYSVLNSLNKAVLFLSISLRGWIATTALAIGAFSVTGIPPVGGFFGKFALFDLAVSDENPLLVALIFVGSLLSIVYMCQLYRRRLATPSEGDDHRWGVQAVSFVLAISLVAIGVYPDPLLNLVQVAAESIPQGFVP